MAKSQNTQDFEKIYKGRLGVIGGYVPQDVQYLGPWLSGQVKNAFEKKEEQGDDFVLLPPVNALATLLKNNQALNTLVNEMISQGLIIHRIYAPDEPYYIKTLMDLLVTLNFMIISTPKFQPNVSHSAFPMSGLFVYMMATTSGREVFVNEQFNDALRNILQWWCDYLDSPASLDMVVTTPGGGWLSPQSVAANNLNQFVTEADKTADPVHWGFKSFNSYFHRQIIPICRPVDGGGNNFYPENKHVVVSSNDGTVYRLAQNVQANTPMEIKGNEYHLAQMLNGQYVEQFTGGDVLQTFLSGHDYHRIHTPISGEVKLVLHIPAYMFSELPGWDSTGGTHSQGYEANVNTRTLIFIDSGDSKLGMVCVMPIGITEISSITAQYANDKPVKEGDIVTKGDEIARFSYGGSSCCVFFQPGAIKQFTVVNPDEGVNSNNGPYVRVNAQIAIANTDSSS